MSDYTGQPGAIVAGSPTYASIEEALSIVPDNNTKPFIIFIRRGLYYEKLTVDKPYVHFIGEDRDETVISFDASGDTPNPNGGIYGTWGCATLQISTPDFRAENLTIENSFDYPANLAKGEDDPTKVHNPQAVALMTSEKSDRAVFRNCKISGYQDTLFPNSGRHYFYNCQILGNVDFIFGAGQAVFDSCEIISRDRKGKNPTGYLTAPSTPIGFPFGFLFVNCRLVKEIPEILKGSVRLGRPWHPNGNLQASGSAVFVNCYMDDHIGDVGYARISSRNSTGRRIWFELKPDSRFFEYASHGTGALATPNRPTLGDMSAQWYSMNNVLNDWSP